MSMCEPDVARTSSHARGPSPLSITCVRPVCAGNPRSKAGIDLLQFFLRCRLHVVVERVAVCVDADGKRPEVLDPELPEALRHQLFPRDLFDLFDLRRLERRGTADD